jgi:hypothetical protein
MPTITPAQTCLLSPVNIHKPTRTAHRLFNSVGPNWTCPGHQIYSFLGEITPETSNHRAILPHWESSPTPSPLPAPHLLLPHLHPANSLWHRRLSIAFLFCFFGDTVDWTQGLQHSTAWATPPAPSSVIDLLIIAKPMTAQKKDKFL